MYDVYVGLGSNLGDKKHYLTQAERYISALKGIRFIKSSNLYLTEPWGKKDQDWFLNKALYLKCSSYWTPFSFLNKILEIESLIGRERKVKWGPRKIDIDLLIFGDFVINTDDLVLPHPYLTKRAFVLIPLLEINPSLRLPTGEVLAEELNQLNYRVVGNKIYQKS